MTFTKHEHGAWCHPSADGCPAEIPAPELTEAERSRVAVFAAAFYPPEVAAARFEQEFVNRSTRTAGPPR